MQITLALDPALYVDSDEFMSLAGSWTNRESVWPGDVPPFTTAAAPSFQYDSPPRQKPPSEYTTEYSLTPRSGSDGALEQAFPPLRRSPPGPSLESPAPSPDGSSVHSKTYSQALQQATSPASASPASQDSPAATDDSSSAACSPATAPRGRHALEPSPSPQPPAPCFADRALHSSLQPMPATARNIARQLQQDNHAFASVSPPLSDLKRRQRAFIKWFVRAQARDIPPSWPDIIERWGTSPETMSFFSSEQIEALSSDQGEFSIDQLRALALTTDQPSALWASSPSTSDDDSEHGDDDSESDGSDGDGSDTPSEHGDNDSSHSTQSNDESDSAHRRITYSRSTYADPVFYSDANLGAFRSTTGYVGYLANGPVMAASRRQRCTCLSSCEAELVALSAATCDVIWLRIFLDELGLRPEAATLIYCDNTGARAVAENPIASRHLKHVARRHFFVQDAVRASEVTVSYVASDANLADLLTKTVCTPRFQELAARLRQWCMAC